MNTLILKARHAQRRMVLKKSLECFFRFLPWTLGVCTAVFLIDWAGFIGLNHFHWVLGAVILPIPLAFLAAYRRRPGLVKAALALDLGAVTHERLSTALSLPDPQTPMERSVVDDANTRIEKVDVRKSVPIVVQPRWKWAGLAILPMAILLLDRPGWDWFGRKEAADKEEERKTEAVAVKKHVDKLKNKVDKFDEKIKNKDMKAAQELSEKMKQIADEMKKETMTKKEVVAKLSGVEESVKRRWEEMGSKNPTAKDLMNKLQNSGAADRGPKAEKMAADLQKAIDEIGKLKKELENKDLSKEEAALGKDKLDKLSKMLEKMDAKNPEALQELMEKLEDMKGDQTVDSKDLMEKLKEAEQGLSDLAKDLSEMGLMEMAMSELQDLKDNLLDLEGT